MLAHRRERSEEAAPTARRMRKRRRKLSFDSSPRIGVVLVHLGTQPPVLRPVRRGRTPPTPAGGRVSRSSRRARWIGGQLLPWTLVAATGGVSRRALDISAFDSPLGDTTGPPENNLRRYGVPHWSRAQSDLWLPRSLRRRASPRHRYRAAHRYRPARPRSLGHRNRGARGRRERRCACQRRGDRNQSSALGHVAVDSIFRGPGSPTARTRSAYRLAARAFAGPHARADELEAPPCVVARERNGTIGTEISDERDNRPLLRHSVSLILRA